VVIRDVPPPPRGKPLVTGGDVHPPKPPAHTPATTHQRVTEPRDHVLPTQSQPVGRPIVSGTVQQGSSVFGVRLNGGVTPHPAIGTAAFERLLDKVTGSVSRPGNQVALLFDGAVSFAERHRLIASAKESVHLQTFVYSSDQTGWALAEALAHKAKEGVAVRVIYDAIGSNHADKKLFAFLKDAGVEVLARGLGLLGINDRWHEKHLIVDGHTSIQGGMNIGDEYAGGGSAQLVLSGPKPADEPWRDVDMRLRGPSVADAQTAFVRNWETLGGSIPKEQQAGLFPAPTMTDGGPQVRVVQHRPREDGDDHTNQLYLACIKGAQHSITIENAYFIPPPEVRQALMDAAKRGVEVRVLTNGVESNNHTFVSEAGRYFYDEMVAAGVQIFERQGSTLHSKTATFDGAYSVVGSHNLNGRSKDRDAESTLSTPDPTVARALEERFTEGLSKAKPVTAAELAGEGFGANLRQWALSSLAWTF
jgi:cardiolipin synthase A/B